MLSGHLLEVDMILGLLASFVLGFFFPPLWLLTVGGLIYLVASASSRRTAQVERRLAAMIATNTTEATFESLYFEAARAYAVSKGGRIFEDMPDVISANVLIDGTVYQVQFMRATGGGTRTRMQPVANVMAQLSGKDDILAKIEADIAAAGHERYSVPYAQR